MCRTAGWARDPQLSGENLGPLWDLARASLGSDFVQGEGCGCHLVLQIAGFPRGFAFQELCCCRARPKHAELPDRDAGEVSANLHLNLAVIEGSSVSDGMKESMLSVVPPVPT